MNENLTRPPEITQKAFADNERDKSSEKVEGKGFVEIEYCPVCGYMAWKKTRPKGELGYQSTPMESPETCNRCATVIRRVPELYEWVTEVIAKAQNDMLDRCKVEIVKSLAAENKSDG